MMQTGEDMMQEGPQLIQQGDFRQGMQLVREGARLEQQARGSSSRPSKAIRWVADGGAAAATRRLP